MRAAGPCGGIERRIADLARIGGQSATQTCGEGIVEARIGQKRANGRVIAVTILGIGVELGRYDESFRRWPESPVKKKRPKPDLVAIAQAVAVFGPVESGCRGGAGQK